MQPNSVSIPKMRFSINSLAKVVLRYEAANHPGSKGPQSSNYLEIFGPLISVAWKPGFTQLEILVYYMATYSGKFAMSLG